MTSVSVAVETDTFQLGLDSYVAGLYQQAMKHWKSAADQGDLVAAFNIGVLHNKGLGVPRDEKESIRWYRRAADAGYAPAQFNLGTVYLNGLGVDKNAETAAFWWEQAANQNYPQAVFNLASLYVNGSGVERDLDTAAKLYLRAGGLGDERARAALEQLEEWYLDKEAAPTAGPALADGEPAPDIKRAQWVLDQPTNHYTIQVAAFSDERSALAFFRKHGIENEIALFRAKTKNQIWHKGVYGSFKTRTKASAVEQKIKSQIPGQSLWIREFGGVQSEIESLQAALSDEKQTPGLGQAPSKQTQAKSADSAPPAKVSAKPGNTGLWMIEDIPGDSPVAAADKVAATRSERTQQIPNEVGESGQTAFEAKRYAEAYELWRPLAESGDPGRQYDLASLYKRGQGVAQNYDEAYRWYYKAAKNGHGKAQFDLGILYERGLGVERNESLSQYWIQTAADQKEPRAVEYIQEQRTRQE